MSSALTDSWARWGRGARVAAIGGATVLLTVVLWLTFSVVRQDYGVLFSDLSTGDAATIVQQLKKDKTPYQLADAGTTVSVPVEQVHEVRLALMSGELPLNGGVGFEVFDKQGLGATEHSQKVSYQRALQGELARTIGALDNVKQVRIHLVLPESTLFTRDRQEASAAVTVAMEPGMSLQRQQIAGVQRLVAAAVPGLDPARVVVADQRGVTLSAADSSGGATGATEARLQVKQDVEGYIAHKVARLLDSAFGPGQAIVSVDALLNFDASKTTIQDLLPAAGDDGGSAGRIVRRRQVTGGGGGEPLWTNASTDGAPAPRAASSSTDIEYEYGRRVDEVVTAPGALSRLSVGVVVPGQLTDERRARITELVRVAAGVSDARGDAVSVQSLSEMGGGSAEADVRLELESLPDAGAIISTGHDSGPVLGARQRIAAATVIGAAILALLALSIRARRPRNLSAADRQRILEEIQRTLADDGVVSGRAARS